MAKSQQEPLPGTSFEFPVVFLIRSSQARADLFSFSFSLIWGLWLGESRCVVRFLDDNGDVESSDGRMVLEGALIGGGRRGVVGPGGEAMEG